MIELYITIGYTVLFCIIIDIVKQLVRNSKVHKFRHYIIDLEYIYNMTRIEEIEFGRLKCTISLIKKFNYHEMLLSIKPLKLESWFTEEELEPFKALGLLEYSPEEIKKISNKQKSITYKKINISKYLLNNKN